MSKSIKRMILVECGLCLAFFVFCAIVCSLYVNHVAPAVLMLTPVFILAALFWITQKDMDKAYIEANEDTIRSVDYYFGIKKEKSFFIQDIAYAEIAGCYSMRVHGYRHSMCGFSYIVFRDNTGKYLLKVICVPETEQFFEKYLNPHGLRN